ncbi:rhomboid family intramembrane serine protease [Robertkochia flava]|uniref:rhomboid family intramembrane serine protease n=1 Tax=Robertkochia flava TaxID=3447986 RepID=UPI001CD00361|nr:rhomboid family intramembrane serine protease [Robertkochia marina]
MNLSMLLVIAANVVVSLKGFNDFSFFERYKFNIGAIQRGEHIRSITSGFLHVDYTHLIFNMITLYFFAPIVISYFGGGKFLVIYFISLIAGSLLATVFHRNDYHYSAVGASGAVTGVLYSAILLRPDMKLFLFFIPIAIPAYIFGIGYLMYSIYGMKNRLGNIGHTAHFGGAIGGYAMTLILMPSLFVEETLMVILLAIPIVILFILEKAGKI